MASQTTAFAKKLQAVRESKGITKYALAKLSGVSKQALSNLESGVREPTWDTVQKLALALGVDCTAFADQALTLPDQAPARPRGRPKKEPAVGNKKRK